MKLLKCLLCRGEMDIIGDEYAINKKVKCLKCGYTNAQEEKIVPEILTLRKRDYK